MCTPTAEMLSLKLSPLKRTRDLWREIKSMPCGRKNQGKLGTFRCHLEAQDAFKDGAQWTNGTTLSSH